MKKLPWSWFDHRADLPQWLFAAIGRVAVEWSMLEREIEEVIRLTSDLPLRTGRIVTTGMNLRSRFMVARNFIQAHVYDNDLDPAFLDEFADLENKITKRLTVDRNMVVHGLWEKRGGIWYVLQTTGTRVEPELQPAIKKFSRAVRPTRKKITPNRMRTILQGIIKANDEIVNFCAQLRAELPTSQYKPPAYTRRRHQIPPRTKQTP